MNYIYDDDYDISFMTIRFHHPCVSIRQQFYDAISVGDICKAKDLFKTNRNYLVCSAILSDSLYAAAVNNKLSCLEFLLSEDVGADIEHNHGIHFNAAVLYGHVDVVRYFLANRISMGVVEQSLLFAISQMRTLEISDKQPEMLPTSEQQSQKSATETSVQSSPSRQSTSNQSPEQQPVSLEIIIVRILLDHLTNINFDNCCLLNKASEYGRVDILEQLIARQIGLNDNTASRAIEMATRNNHVHVLEWFFARGYCHCVTIDTLRCCCLYSQLTTIECILKHASVDLADLNNIIEQLTKVDRFNVIQLILAHFPSTPLHSNCTLVLDNILARLLCLQMSAHPDRVETSQIGMIRYFLEYENGIITNTGRQRLVILLQKEIPRDYVVLTELFEEHDIGLLTTAFDGDHLGTLISTIQDNQIKIESIASKYVDVLVESQVNKIMIAAARYNYPVMVRIINLFSDRITDSTRFSMLVNAITNNHLDNTRYLIDQTPEIQRLHGCVNLADVCDDMLRLLIQNKYKFDRDILNDQNHDLITRLLSIDTLVIAKQPASLAKPNFVSNIRQETIETIARQTFHGYGHDIDDDYKNNKNKDLQDLLKRMNLVSQTIKNHLLRAAVARNDYAQAFAHVRDGADLFCVPLEVMEILLALADE